MTCITIFTKNCGECPVKLEQTSGRYFCVLYKKEITDLTICECKKRAISYGKVRDEKLFPRIKDLP